MNKYERVFENSLVSFYLVKLPAHLNIILTQDKIFVKYFPSENLWYMSV